MAMVGTARGDACYNAIAASNPDFAKLSAGEKATLKTYFETLFGADTTYIQGNAEADPGATLVADLATFISASPGSPVTGAGLLTGKGTIA